ncbi:MAG: hypothetical protein M0036_10290 [Desulfobacteraceae bacterium]|nr:hypothetical protein [Desulfobacteraceae bacterium]
MTPYSLARTIAAAVAQDAALQAWATAQFSAALTVYLGIPSEDFPNMETDAPFVAFGDPSRQASRDRRQVTYGLLAWMGLRVSGMATTGIDHLVEPTGLDTVNDGLALLITAVAAALPEGCELVRADQETGTLTAHDWVEGFVGFEVEERLVMGQDPLD